MPISLWRIQPVSKIQFPNWFPKLRPKWFPNGFQKAIVGFQNGFQNPSQLLSITILHFNQYINPTQATYSIPATIQTTSRETYLKQLPMSDFLGFKKKLKWFKICFRKRHSQHFKLSYFDIETNIAQYFYFDLKKWTQLLVQHIDLNLLWV